jgi:hypothetical protein
VPDLTPAERAERIREAEARGRAAVHLGLGLEGFPPGLTDAERMAYANGAIRATCEAGLADRDRRSAEELDLRHFSPAERRALLALSYRVRRGLIGPS